jgi:hypothetical protein
MEDVRQWRVIFRAQSKSRGQEAEAEVRQGSAQVCQLDIYTKHEACLYIPKLLTPYGLGLLQAKHIAADDNTQ